MRELTAREVKKLMVGTNSAKACFEKVAEELKYERNEWWLLWHFFKAGVDYERQREKLNAPIYTKGEAEALCAVAVAATKKSFDLCEDCPPLYWTTDKTRCKSCPRTAMKRREAKA
jgi:hypothetical protein